MNRACRKIRKNILTISKHSGHGHIPTCFSIVELLYGVYRHMRHRPDDPAWPRRDLFYLSKFGELPRLKEVWFFAIAVPLMCGSVVTLGAGGAEIWNRVIGAVVCGVAVGVFSTVISAALGFNAQGGVSEIAVIGLWRIFVFTILSVAGLLFTEIKLPEPKTN